MIARYYPKDIAAIWTDESKFNKFLEIEILLCEALAKQGKMPKDVAAKIRKKAKISVAEIEKIEEKTHHDIVAFLWNVSESIGKEAQYLHWGLTSSDLLDTTLAWQIKDASDIILKELDAVIKAAKAQALKHKDTVCVGRSHGVHAETYSAGLKFALLYDELKRAETIFKEALPRVCAGKISGAVGNFAYLDPKVEEYICKKIGISNALISTQVVSRDRVAYYLSALSLIGALIERFSTEIRHLHRNEVKEMEEPFYSGQKGSSAMPHKKNPIVCERLCGMARLLRSNMQAAYENINLWHERDISHSSVERVILPDSTALVVYMLRKFKTIVKDVKVNKQNMLDNLYKSGGIVFSQGFLLTLMQKGLERPKAYDVIQKVALNVQTNKSNFLEEIQKDATVNKLLSNKEIKQLSQPEYYLRNINKIYKRLGLV